VQAVLSWSYQALTPAAARLFPLLGLHPGPEVSPAAAATPAGLPAEGGRPGLAEPTGARLLGEHPVGRDTLPQLLHAYSPPPRPPRPAPPPRHRPPAGLLPAHRVRRRTAAVPRPGPDHPPPARTRYPPAAPRRLPAGPGLVHGRAPRAACRHRPRRHDRFRHPHLATGLDPGDLPLPAWALARPGRRRPRRGGRRPTAGRPDRAGPRPRHPRPRLHPAGPPRRRPHPPQPRPGVGHPHR